MAPRTLDDRQLNRTLLDRQSLLRRVRRPASAMVERLVGLQAQVPRDPYIALWSRIEGFQPDALARPLEQRRAVRMTLFRGTLHLVTDRDALALRPVLHEAILRLLYTGSPFGRRLEGLDVEELTSFATQLLEEQPRTRAQLAPLLAERWPTHDGPSLAYAVTYLLPLVQVTPRGLWGRSGASAFTTLERWLGRPLPRRTVPDDMVLRYLAAFGPSTPADLQSWSGLRGTAELLDGLRPKLRTYRDADGRELFDVAGGRLRAADTVVPVRFLPEYDNALLAHARRSRIVAEGTPQWTDVGWGSVLVDGFGAARWRLDKTGAILSIEPFRRLAPAVRAELGDEAARLGAFLTDGQRAPAIRIARV
jgi:hypothetical protein